MNQAVGATPPGAELFLGSRHPARYGPRAVKMRASGGCCASNPYVPRSSHSIPQAICDGSSQVWLKTLYVATTRIVASTPSAITTASECARSHAAAVVRRDVAGCSLRVFLRGLAIP